MPLGEAFVLHWPSNGLMMTMPTNEKTSMGERRGCLNTVGKKQCNNA